MQNARVHQLCYKKEKLRIISLIRDQRNKQGRLPTPKYTCVSSGFSPLYFHLEGVSYRGKPSKEVMLQMTVDYHLLIPTNGKQ